MKDTTLDYIRKHIETNEKPVDWPYLDNTGHVTAGTGFLADTEKSFAKLPWRVTGDDGKMRPATEAEKRDAFRALKNQDPENRDAHTFENETAMRLPDDTRDRLFAEKVREHVGGARREVGDAAWGKLTPAQQAMLTDVRYANGSLKKYPKLTEAARDGDGAAMARESHFYAGEKDGVKQRNWKRIKANHCSANGLVGEACVKSVAEHYADKPERDRLPPEYREFMPKQKQDVPANDDDHSGEADTPEAKAFMADVMKEYDQVDSIMLKQPASWTADEARQVMNKRAGLPDSDPRMGAIFKAERDYFKQAYGDGPMATDETGRGVDVKPAAAMPMKASSAQDADGAPLRDSLRRAARRLVQDGGTGKGGYGPVVKRLQDGLNMINKMANASGSDGPESRLKLDGVMGPKTRGRLRDALGKDGFGRLDETMALGRFKDFAERSRSGGSGGKLGKETELSFASLFRAPDERLRGPKIESSVLQETLNGFGARQPGYKPLKLDGDIGPKTSSAFDLFNKRLGPDQLTTGLGKSFGFFA